ncbi:hypothetical protein RGCCGE502_04760 [Rhizobium grahamii CCGE 502]|uniref:Uncharacterized protein n=1 Tax=Rhizobium grahamii CCGE 502 TaxID=990285 RepID=S3HN45_9HYPH|nr:hypothetical protein RGCCGE502_04760 [Rhizobium grahamii CCGE 502]
MPARNTVVTRVAILNKPVADVEAGIGAETHQVRLSHVLPEIAVLLLNSVHAQAIRLEAKAVTAPDALAIVEMNNLIAVVTYKQPQRAPPSRSGVEKPLCKVDGG